MSGAAGKKYAKGKEVKFYQESHQKPLVTFYRQQANYRTVLSTPLVFPSHLMNNLCLVMEEGFEEKCSLELTYNSHSRTCSFSFLMNRVFILFFRSFFPEDLIFHSKLK